MNVEQAEIRYHREQMANWLKVLHAAKEAGDQNMEQQAIRERRKHTDAVLALWASPAEQLAVCV
ncbi:hypothetical protein [Paenibacillus graminis]|uniref:PH domain-containing protein n=1 Tax=Paenibacillus graminis TaxID=189425 RepID=A0A089M8E0_9BACL|nr:hypothetical protein [Paenibacillus graminis]AIQ69507.1 hypothetical protein PGRAT_19075 [Paenibacillus graminis]